MKSIDKIKQAFAGVLNLKTPAASPTIPAPAVLLSVVRPGLSALKTTFSILAEKKELGLPVGDYEDGSMNQNDLLIYAIVKAIFKALQEDAKISVTIEPGIPLVGTGTSPVGPVAVVGATDSIGMGGAIIQ
jgi:hypothetical protein